MAGNVEIVGGSFTGFTVKLSVLASDVAPSLTVRVMTAEPFWFAAGVIVRVRFAPVPPNTSPPTGTRALLDEEAIPSATRRCFRISDREGNRVGTRVFVDRRIARIPHGWGSIGVSVKPVRQKGYTGPLPGSYAQP
jgi:hypothetical protein